MTTIAARWPRILSEQLVSVPEPLTLALAPGSEAPARSVILRAARALLDQPSLARGQPWPEWLAPHQVTAAERLSAIIARYGGALLADEVGLGKSYVALAVALAQKVPFSLIVPAVLVAQWRTLLDRLGASDTPIISHESLSVQPVRPSARPPVGFIIVDEAHRFRNPETNRYRALARMTVGARVLLVSATPIHNRVADLLHLLRLFLRDHALAALGVPSLHQATRHACDATLTQPAIARLVVARSRERVQSGYTGGPIRLSFPRSSGDRVRAGPTTGGLLVELIEGVAQLKAGGSAAPLLRLMLLRRLSSSLAAFRAALVRHEAYLDMVARAAADNRSLTAHEFQRCFPRASGSDLQLVLFPLLLQNPGVASDTAQQDRRMVEQLRRLLAQASPEDPKADALERLLAGRPAKTIVFSDARPTVRYLMQRLRSRRVAAVFGGTGRFAAGDANRGEVLRAFAPRAQGVAPPPEALATDLLIATDLLSEGLNLQDAERVVHYDLPWSPARLAQRVGRIDRLDSPHRTISTVTFLPPHALARALTIEERLAAKVGAQHVAGTNGGLDWCDRLAALASCGEDSAPVASCAAVRGPRPCSILVVRIAGLAEAFVVDDGVARAGPTAATRLLTDAVAAVPAHLDRTVLGQVIESAAPLIKARLAAVQDARWRAGDRDRFARRLIPWVLAWARRAARRGDSAQLRALDGLVSRLSLGMTAGEELLLEDLLSHREPLTVKDLLGWHDRLPRAAAGEEGIAVALVAALMVVAERVTPG